MMYEHKVLTPLNKLKRRLDLELGATADFLAAFGINQGNEAKAYADKKFKEAMAILNIPMTNLAARARKLEVIFDNFFKRTNFPLADVVERNKKIIDVLIDMGEWVDKEAVRLSKISLEKTLTASPATLLEGFENSRGNIGLASIEIPVPELNILPEIKMYEAMLDESDTYLYTDAYDTPLQKSLTVAGDYSDKRADFPGKVVSVSKALENTDLRKTIDIGSMSRVWENDVDLARVPNFLIPMPEKEITLEKAKFIFGIFGAPIYFCYWATFISPVKAYHYWADEAQEEGISWEDSWNVFATEYNAVMYNTHKIMAEMEGKK